MNFYIFNYVAGYKDHGREYSTIITSESKEDALRQFWHRVASRWNTYEFVEIMRIEENA